MGTFMADGAAVLPGVKVDARPAAIPEASDEWAANDSNEMREALLDLRTAVLAASGGAVTATAALVDLPGWGLTGSNSLAALYGDMVSVNIVTDNDGSVDSWAICTLPVGYRPAHTQVAIMCRIYQNASYYAALATISTAGEIAVEFYDNGSVMTDVAALDATSNGGVALSFTFNRTI